MLAFKLIEMLKHNILPVIEKLYFSPVKSLSFLNSKNLVVKKEVGIKNDRIFAFTRFIDEKKSRNFETDPQSRNLDLFLTLKNSPFLNKYNFDFNEEELSLIRNNKLVKKISIKDKSNYKTLVNELVHLEGIKKSTPQLIHNVHFPFFDTMPHNSVSLVNMNSVLDLEKKALHKINHERFRANIYVKNVDSWAEFHWINRKILINNCRFKVLKKISRCSATNLPQNSGSTDINLPRKLREIYGHIYMGVYLQPLNDGNINVNDIIEFKNF